MPFPPLAFKLGVAKFYGWDPTPIRPDEKLLKTTSGDFDFANCSSRVIKHDEPKNFKEFQGNHHIVALAIGSMVKVAIQTNRTLVLPQCIRSDEDFGAPTHPFVDVRSLGVPYRVMTREEAFEIKPDEMQLVKASHMFHTRLNRTLEARHNDTKFLAMERVCTIREADIKAKVVP